MNRAITLSIPLGDITVTLAPKRTLDKVFKGEFGGVAMPLPEDKATTFTAFLATTALLEYMADNYPGRGNPTPEKIREALACLRWRDG